MSQQSLTSSIPELDNLIVLFTYKLNPETRKPLKETILSCLNNDPSNVIQTSQIKKSEEHQKYKKILQNFIYQNHQQKLVYPEVFIFENISGFGITNIISLFQELELKDIGYFGFEEFVWNNKKNYYLLTINNE
jgi:hypothetical protein